MRNNRTTYAYLGGGCFWCTESLFLRLKGVISVTSGYAGGTTKNPTYEDVSSGNTGHAEIIRVEFDPKVISYKTLLSVFFTTHDPTTPNQQGHDYGSQYRSIILTTTAEQQTEALEKIREIQEKQIFDQPLVTVIEPLKQFFEAELYHQNYFDTHQTDPYCQIVIFPKINYLKKQYAHLLK